MPKKARRNNYAAAITTKNDKIISNKLRQDIKAK